MVMLRLENTINCYEGCNNGYKNALCRFCGSEQPGIDIFSLLGQEHNLSIKIKLCNLPFQVERDDVLPTFLCYSCINKLNIFYEFYHTILEVQTSLLERDGNRKETGKPAASAESVCNTSPEKDKPSLEAPVPEPTNADCDVIDICTDDEDRSSPVSHKRPKMVTASSLSSSTCGKSQTQLASGKPDSRGLLPDISPNNGVTSKITSTDDSSKQQQKLPTMNWVPPRGITIIKKELAEGKPPPITSISLVEDGEREPLGTIDITGPKETADIQTIDITIE